MKLQLPHLPSVSIARRLRRVLLLQIIFIFSLYMLIFTVINSVLNFESQVTRDLTNSYGQVTILQSADDLTERIQELAMQTVQRRDAQTVGSLKQSVIELQDRLDALHQLSKLTVGVSLSDQQDLQDQISFIRNDLYLYLNAVARYVDVELPGTNLKATTSHVSQSDVVDLYQQVRSDVVDTRSRLESLITQGQSVLLDSQNRRTALLGLQAIVVIVSLISIGFGYIAPAFQRVLSRLAHQNSELRDLDQTKMEFLSIASHQLKTPLSGLKWNLALLYRLRHNLNERDRKYLSQAKEHTDAMVRLVSNFLNVSRIEQGRMEFDIQTTDIVPLVKAVLRTNSRLASMHQVEVKLHTDRPKILARVDALLFKQVIQNLVDNAILYNKKGGLVTVSARHIQERIVLEVADTGSGISETEQRRIFGQFFRGENAKTMRPDGSGLGLYFVKKIVQKMSGTITCKSKLGVGTAFTVSVPRV